ncbi:Alanine racemase [Gossypium arboreum]|uniref:Uncharacterized protein n=2 Tax=Gossypium arboreum TaxID=29729 RepID=A0ABR0P684_GOSAR|nr:hypothetical protein PVK06_029292 [Gossypium arboreum]KHG23442.1 Alanine racemase [Gossypium arboreum]
MAGHGLIGGRPRPHPELLSVSGETNPLILLRTGPKTKPSQSTATEEKRGGLLVRRSLPRPLAEPPRGSTTFESERDTRVPPNGGSEVYGGSTGVKTGHFGAGKQPSGFARAEGAHGRGVRREGDLGFPFS